MRQFSQFCVAEWLKQVDLKALNFILVTGKFGD
jgi:hypothetical protein